MATTHHSPLTTHHSEPTLAPAVRSSLAALRGRIRWYVCLEGLACGAVWLGVAFWISLTVDWFFEPPVWVRGVLLAVVAAVLAAVLVKLIALRAFVRLSNSNMATLLERRFRHLDDSLLTAVMLTEREKGVRNLFPEQPVAGFAQKVPDSSCSRQMLAQTCQEAAERIADVRLGQVFNPRPMAWSMTAAVLLSGTVIAFFVMFAEAGGVWTDRSLLFSDTRWIRRSQIEVEGFDRGIERVARGADFEVVALAHTTIVCGKPGKSAKRSMKLPRSVYIRYRVEGGRRGWEPMDRIGEAKPPEKQRYTHTFQGVLADHEFDVIGEVPMGRDVTVPDLRIKVVDSPTISGMRLRCTYPAYMHPPHDKRKTVTLPVTGMMQIPIGTQVTVEATANKPLVEVRIDSSVGSGETGVGSGETGNGLSSKVLNAKDLSADHRGFSHTIKSLTEDTTLRFTLSDVDGITGREPVRLALVVMPDTPPMLSDVRLRGIGPAITANARLPAVGNVSDDYGIDKLAFHYLVPPAARDAVPPAARDAVPPAARDAVDQQQTGTQAIELRSKLPTILSLRAVMEVGGLEMTPGQKLTLWLEGTDLGGGTDVGTSERWLKDVVTPAQLRAMLEARELVLRQRFERIIEEVTETRDLLLDIDFDDAPSAESPDQENPEEETPGGAEPGDETSPIETLQQRLESRSLAVQRALQNSRKNSHETLGTAEGFDDVRLQFINNRIDTEELNTRLQKGITEPLRHIGRKMFGDLETRLRKLEQYLSDEQLGPQKCDLARQQSVDILIEMRKVLDRMIELESFNEAVELLRTIIKLQEDLHEKTKQRHKEEIRKLLED